MDIVSQRTEHIVPRLPLSARLLLLGVLLWLGNEFGAMLRYPDLGSAVLFPPYAILTTALLFAPSRDWPWYFLTGFMAHALAMWPTWTWSWVALADAANMARAFAAAWLLRRIFKGPPQLVSVSSLLQFVGVVVLVAPAVGATIGAANAILHHTATSYPGVWLAWFMSNALTGLTLMPALIGAMTTITGPSPSTDRRHVAECIAIALGLIVSCALVFLPLYSSPGIRTLSLYGPLPLLIWAALRCEPGGAGFATTVVALAAVWATDRDTGPFISASLDDKVLGMQLFVLLSTLPVLCLAVVASARRRVVRMHDALLASLQDQVAIIDARGIVLQISDSWLRFANSSAAQPFDRMREGGDYLAAVREAATHGNTIAADVLGCVSSVLNGDRPRFQMEYEQGSADRREWYTLSAEVLERVEGGAVITRSNVTTRRQADIEIQEQRRELSHLARVAVLGQLSGAFAHELRQPLSSIRVNAEAARLLLKRDPIDLRELSLILEDIVSDDERAGRVIESLRGLLKTGESHTQEVRPRDLIEEVLELAHVELMTRRVKATVSIDPHLPPLLGDRVQLQQVLLNLILNACEAMEAADDNERTIFMKVALAGDNDVQISVSDNGTGIPGELIDRLFEPFVTSKPQGFGLGLSITRTIVAAHGGRVWAENNPTGGATIHCLFESLDSAQLATYSGTAGLASSTPGGITWPTPATRR